MPVFALVDCNNFYASCEKLFDPTLLGKPIVVLSNNDGCVVARSAEVKALGIPMGVPWFQLKDAAKQHGIVAFSSNYSLYADMSNRVVKVLSGFSPNIEVYSIDESFLELAGFERQGYAAYGRTILEHVGDWLGLAVCVGIGPTKTLSKLANHCAKKKLAGNDGVCDFTVMSSEELTTLFDQVEVRDVWGIGRRINERLVAMGIRTVRELRDVDTETLRSEFSVVVERTVRELRGISCLDMQEIAPDKQQIMSSRSFGQPVHDLQELQEAVSSYIAKATEKLRAQGSVAGAVQVQIRTSPFKPDAPHYQRAVTIPLAAPSDDTRVLTNWALRILKKIYRPGYAYQKAGVMLQELSPKMARQISLFQDTEGDERSERLMSVLDDVNQKWGRGTVRLLSEGFDKSWEMRRGNLSPAYTTNWDELPKVLAQ